MKAIFSPYSDDAFNEYLLHYVKDHLKKWSFFFIEFEYTLEDKKYTVNDIIKSIQRNGRMIFFNNQKLVNYAVYDLSQRFWYEEFKNINNIVRKLYLHYRRHHQNDNKSINKRERKLFNEEPHRRSDEIIRN